MTLRHGLLRLAAVVAVPSFLVVSASTQTSTEELKRERLNAARAYLVAANVNGPLDLDAAHAKELKTALLAWFDEKRRATETTTQQPAHTAFSYTASLLEKNTKAPTESDVFRWLTPTSFERLARITEHKFELQEQPKTVVVNNNQTLNPDHALWKYSVNLDFSQMFISASDVSSIYTGAKGFTDNRASLQDGPCRGKDTGHFMDCLRRADKMGILNRAVSGVKGSFAISQNPQVVNGVLVPGTIAADTKRLYSGEVDFDPSGLFPSGSDWKSALAAADTVETSGPKVITRHCAEDPQGDDCFRELAGPSKQATFLAAFIPKISYQVKTQFDFIKQGGEFVQPLFPESHLWYLSFTMDVRKATATIKGRTDALVPLKLLATPTPTNSALSGSGACSLELPPASEGEYYQYELDGGQDRKWSLDASQCLKADPAPGIYKKTACQWNGLEMKENGVLSGIPLRADAVTLKLKISTTSGSVDSCAKIAVKGRQNESEKVALLLDYLELSVDPDVVLNDHWFEQFRQDVRKTLLSQSANLEVATVR